MPNHPNLTETEWDEITKRLILYAHHRVFRLWWRGLCPDPAEIAAVAICKVIDGTRNWNRSDQPDFEAFLKGIVDSEISHQVTASDNRRRSSDQVSDTVAFDSRPSPHGAPDRRMRDADNVAEAEQFRTLVLQEIGDDELVVRLFECLSADITAPSEIAILLERDVKEVNNAQKRLRRKVDSALRKQKGRLHV